MQEYQKRCWMLLWCVVNSIYNCTKSKLIMTLKSYQWCFGCLCHLSQHDCWRWTHLIIGTLFWKTSILNGSYINILTTYNDIEKNENREIYYTLKNDLIEHLWARKGKAHVWWGKFLEHVFFLFSNYHLCFEFGVNFVLC